MLPSVEISNEGNNTFYKIFYKNTDNCDELFLIRRLLLKHKNTPKNILNILGNRLKLEYKKLYGL